MNRVDLYFKMKEKIAGANDQAEEARWAMAKIIWEERKQSSIANCAVMFGSGNHHIIYMTNAWDRRRLKPPYMTFSVFYNSPIVRGMDPRKR
jgi:hypothetical protein